MKNEPTKVDQLIAAAKAKYPVSVPYKGILTEEEICALEKQCDIHCSSVYMDGSGYYNIRYWKPKNE